MSKHRIELLESRIAPAGISSIDLGSLTGVNGFKLNGSVNSQEVGYSISNAGDINGDGLDDLVIGGPGTPGTAYVVFGQKSGLPASLNLASLDGTNGFKLTAEFSTDRLGVAVSSAGDFNGDGFGDFVVGAENNTSSTGAAYLIYGHAGAFPANLSLSSLNGAVGSKISGASPGDVFGSALGRAGDLNADGYDDLVLGERGTGLDQNGAAYVVFGKGGGLGASFNVSSLNGSNDFKAFLNEIGSPNAVGRSVAGAGDINGDGYDDVLITANLAPEGGTYRGAAFIIYGKPTAYTATVNLATLTGPTGFRVSGTVDGDRLGDSAAGLGDINGDGYDDFIVGATNAGATDRGSAYVVFGRPGGFGAGMLITEFDGANGFRILGAVAGDFLGVVGGPLDFNGDGFSDLLVSSANATEVGSLSGATYVVYGHPGSFSQTFIVADLNGNNGLKIRGAADSDFSGSALGAGDFNGDGFDDVYVGAPDAGAGDPGAGYVVFGFGPKVTISKDGRIATFQETDGDLVTVKITKGLLRRTDIVIDPDGNFQKLALLDDHGAFSGASLSITAKKPVGGTGDGRVNLGALDARGSDLKSVLITGDLGQIDCGDANLLTPALGSLTAASIGTTSSTQPAGTIDPFTSRIDGSVKTIKVAGHMAGVLQIAGNLGSIRIGGDLDGDAGGAAAGLIRVNGNINSVAVAGDVLGGANFSGILSGAKIGNVAIGGSLISTPSKPVHIAALGKLNPTSTADAIAIKSITIGGGCLYGRILAGYTTSLGALNGDAGIGKVVVNQDFAATSIVAGVADTSVPGNLASTPNGFGSNDTALRGGNPDVIARIASIVLKLPPAGTMAPTDVFAFTAESVDKVLIAGKPLPLNTDKNFLILNPPLTDLGLIEL